MSKKAKIKTWLFLFIGLFLLTVFTLIVGNNQNLFYPTKDYKARFNDIQGLFEGSVVTVNGIRAGNIKNMEFNENNIIVTFGIRKKYVQYINQSSKAYIKTQGLVGDKYIAIQTVESAPPLNPDDFIQAESNQMLSLFSEQGELSQNISLFFKEAAVFLSKINQGEDQNFLGELSHISKQTQKFFSDQNNKEVQAILKHTKNILKKIDKGQGTLGALVNTPSLHNRALSFFGGKPYKKFLKSVLPQKKEPSKRVINSNEEF